MIETPLDCVGIAPRKADVGKHDFRFHQPKCHEADYLAKLSRTVAGPSDLTTAEEELAEVTRERDILVAKLTEVANGIDTRPGRVIARELLAKLKPENLRTASNACPPHRP
ncbi:hypothetical protein ACYOEI_06830 [Singulisphaera rosea]